MDGTNINDLPSQPISGEGNIKLNINEMPTLNNQNTSESSVSLDQSTINQIISGLQKATMNGATQLQSRDIPMNTEEYTQDTTVQPDYIPAPVNVDYIKEEEYTAANIIHNYDRKNNTNNNLENLYNEIQIPLLIGVLFFMFQLPFFKKVLYKYFPILFFQDGNQNLYGLFFISILFSIIYYFIYKIMTNLV
jgi:hypothetical protein